MKLSEMKRDTTNWNVTYHEALVRNGLIEQNDGTLSIDTFGDYCWIQYDILAHPRGSDGLLDMGRSHKLRVIYGPFNKHQSLDMIFNVARAHLDKLTLEEFLKVRPSFGGTYLLKIKPIDAAKAYYTED